MAMTVKKLIDELEKIDNKFLEIEVALIDKATLEPEIRAIQKWRQKIMIILERKK
jgi:hypothetical protein